MSVITNNRAEYWNSPGKFFGLDLSEIVTGRENYWGHLGEGAHLGAGASLTGRGWEVYYGSCEKSPPAFAIILLRVAAIKLASCSLPGNGIMEGYRGTGMIQGLGAITGRYIQGGAVTVGWGNWGIPVSHNSHDCQGVITACSSTRATKCVTHRRMEKGKYKYSALSDSLCLSLER